MLKLEFTAIDYAVIAIYFVLVFSINFIVKVFSKEKTKNESETLESYFLAGRRLTLPVFLATLVTTWYGNILGVSEIAYKHGIVQWLTQGVFWYLMYLFFAFYLADKIRDSALFTLPDQIEKFYDSKTAILAALINLIMLNPATYILSIGVIVEMLFGFETWVGIVIGTLVPFIYTLRGGFKAVVYTDVIQFLFMFLGLGLIIPFAIKKYGFNFFLENMPQGHLQIFSSLHADEWSWQVILAWFLIATWTLIDTSFYQRTYAAKDIKTAQRGILLATVFWFVFDLLITFTGIFAFVVDPSMTAVQALPSFANDVLPSFAKGIFFTGLLATVMSTLDSLTFSSAMCISKDLYQKIFKIKDAKKIIAFNKFAIVVVVALGLLVAINFESMVKIMYYKGTIGVSGLLLVMLAGFFMKKKLKPNSAFMSILFGSLGSILWMLVNHFDLVGFHVEPLFVGLGLAVLPFICKDLDNLSSRC